MRTHRRAWRDRCLATAAVIAIWTLAWAPGALAAPAQGVSGTVVNGTTDRPVPDLEVTLHLFSETAELGSMKTTTDAKGAFSFPGLTTDAKGYQLTAVYRDVLYRNQMAALAPGEPIDATLKVYDTTRDPSKIVEGSWIVWIDRGGTQSCTGGICVQHNIQWNNSGDTSYTGSLPSSGGAPIVTRVPLAAGATDFQFLGVYLDTPGQVQGSTYVNPQPIVPRTSSATLRYSVKELDRLTFPFAFPTTSFELWVPVGVDVTADGLTASGEVADQGVTYERYVASDLKPGDTIDVSLSGLEGGGAKGSPILLGIAGGIIVVLAGGLALWKIAGREARGGRGATARKVSLRRPAPKQRATQKESNDRRGRTPLRAFAGDNGDGPGVDDGYVDQAEAEERFDLLIDEIAALDLAHERGLLEPRKYEALRADAKARLLRLRDTKTGDRSSR